MNGTSQGTSYPDEATTYLDHSYVAPSTSRTLANTDSGQQSQDENFDVAIKAAAENVVRIERINSASDQKGRTWSLPVDPNDQSRTPIWSGRMKWQNQVRQTLNSESGVERCKEHQVDPERVYAVAVTMAGVADRRTGRRVTASRENLADKAGVSVTVLKRARRVLSNLGLAKEMVRGRLLRTVEQWAAEAHHGRRQTKATSVWALVSPKLAVVEYDLVTKIGYPSEAPRASLCPQPAVRGPQSLGTSLSSSSSVRKNYITRARAHTRQNPAPATRRPRSIALQIAAAELVRHAPALNPPGHIGAVCDALRAYSVDPSRWSGRDIARRLSDDTRARGWLWPDSRSLKNPVAFLRWRLARIDWSLPSPTELAVAAKSARDAQRREVEWNLRDRTASAASQTVRESAMAKIHAVLSQVHGKPSVVVYRGKPTTHHRYS